MNNSDMLICPVCRRRRGTESPLTPNNTYRTWSCPERHGFDRAAAGYLNLLPPSGRHIHGDSKEMILARRALLDSGLYAPLCNALTDLLDRYLDENAIIWDGGCGEGYYSSAVAERGSDRGWQVWVSDLSKDALKVAAKRDRRLIPIAASSYALPVRSRSCDALLCFFAPQATDEFRRILRDGALLVQAVPGERHLFELKEAIYDTPYENKVNRTPPEGFETAECVEVKRTVTITDRTLIGHLFGMTPYAHRTPPSGLERLSALTELTTTLHFYIFVYRKYTD